MKKFFWGLKTKIEIRIFWSDAFDSMRRKHYKMAYEQGIDKGKIESRCTACINQMEGLFNEN